MNNNLELMLNVTKQTVELSNLLTTEREQRELEAKESRKTTEYDHEAREVIMIKSIGLNIDLFEPANPKDDYYDAMEYYYCSNERWNVLVRNLLYDADLGTILQVLDLTDKETGEKIHFYCDLWCQNTPKLRLEKLKILLTMSAKEFIDQEFGIYYSIPSLLRERGYLVDEKNYTFDTDKCVGHLEIRKPIAENEKSSSANYCELIISHYHYISTFVRNKRELYSLKDNISYDFTYQGEQDIEHLCQVIDAFLEHLDGKYGYYENNTYYQDKHVKQLFDKYKRKLEHLYDVTNSWSYPFNLHDYDEPMTEEEQLEYNRIKDIVTINHYKGAEIYKKYQVHLNRDASYLGGIDNVYSFEILYNTNIDKENCQLTIAHNIITYIGSKNLESEYQEDKNIIDNKHNVTTLTGSYTYLSNIIENFLDNLVAIKSN